MSLSRRRFVALALATPLGLALPGTASAAPEKEDYEAVGGHFFGQTTDKPNAGFGVSDADGVGFWAALKALGGAETVGYPTSRRFSWQGRPTQVFQRAVFQYEPLEKRVVLLNVMDLLHDAGRDGWLRAARHVPGPLPPDFDAGKSWPEIVVARQALLDGQPALREAYFAVRDPLALYGLPTSAVEDFGGHYAIRLQRAVLQLWKQETPWAGAGEVTRALVGDIARDAGLFGGRVGGADAAAAFVPEAAWQPAPPAPPPPPPPPGPQVTAIGRPSAVGPGERWIDVSVARQWLTLVEGDTPVYSAPVTTGKPSFPTPRGTFQIYSRVPSETMDSLTLGIPRGAPEGYYLKDILYTQYFLPGGYALHTNYWQPTSVFGRVATSHGCIGMRRGDALAVWNFAGIGTKVHVH
ncbi:MAG TPA: L,D-transpeptidase [Chloroflexota bacterium]|jgi:lipoprotein-anchoring transpeptidase ErfK/SrfK|nr:L,D-transpeptidase [Chloroflexota bacterium]